MDEVKVRRKVVFFVVQLLLSNHTELLLVPLQTLDDAQQHLDDASSCHSSALHALLSPKKVLFPWLHASLHLPARPIRALSVPDALLRVFFPNFVPLCFGPHVTRPISNP